MLFPYRPLQSIESFSMLYSTSLLVIYFMYSNMYTSILISQFIPLPPLSNLSVLKLFKHEISNQEAEKKKPICIKHYSNISHLHAFSLSWRNDLKWKKKKHRICSLRFFHSQFGNCSKGVASLGPSSVRWR